MSITPPIRGRRQRPAKANPESGFILLAVLIILALLVLALSVAIPKVTTEIRRDKELELYHRGMEYAHAIRHYFKKFGRYPASIEQLQNTNELRFLRKRYKDPITGKDDWRLIHMGEALVPPTGLFGQPLQTVGTPGQQSIYAHPPTDDGSGTGQDNGQNNGTPGNSGNTSTSPVVTASGAPVGGENGNIGGGPIVGVASGSTKASIRLFRQQTHYNQWEFIYDPLEDVGNNTGTGIAQQPIPIQGNGGAPGSPLAPSSTGPGSPIGPTSPINPTTPTTPDTPQQ
jgi:type II secretory pathway pseudopilin PulG